ncbi:MAG: copper resistance CopC family protein [Gammaproteobacteria bacterium]
MRISVGWSEPRRGGCVIVFICLGLGFPAFDCPAHAIVLESNPSHDARLAAPPMRAVLRFNSKIEHGLSHASLEDDQGKPLAASLALQPGGTDRLSISLPVLGPGTYVLRYRVLATDGHITTGVLRFRVLAAPVRG